MLPIVFDVEATGLQDHDQIIEAAYLFLPATPGEFLDGWRIPEQVAFHSYFEPDEGIEIAFGAQATHNILRSDLIGKPHPSTFKLPDDVSYIIGHNADYDMGMVEAHADGICTLAMSRHLHPDMDSHKQAAMLYMYARELGVDAEIEMRKRLTGSHSADVDILNCTTLLRFLLRTAEQRGHIFETWDDVYRFSELARIPLVMTFGKHKGERIADVPMGYVSWYLRQPDQDPLLVQAFRNAGKCR